MAVSVSPFCSKRIPGGLGAVSLASFPSTSSSRSRMVTLTPLGTMIGFFPIRDITHLLVVRDPDPPLRGTPPARLRDIEPLI